MEPNHSRHPCYDEDAHHFFARMHVAVAPGCNIRCNYCNRKYDCVSESRPGVVSKVLSPEEAVRKVETTLQTLPQLTVIGVAGPGDPLANPEATFETFRLLNGKVPGLHLCLSTNGLRLAEFADRIAELSIRHVTVTVNAVDPRIGEKIYGWVADGGKVYRGLEASELLLERQLKGIRMMAERGIAIKVNSVLIPGVNDCHLEEVTARVKELGAFTHNIMPLILSPGSPYEKEGVKEPKPSMVLKAQEASSRLLPVMRHCRQCRADAVGLLGEDTSVADKGKVPEGPVKRIFTMEQREKKLKELDAAMEAKRKVKAGSSSPAAGGSAIRIAVATRGGGKVNVHFGHAKEFLVYEVTGKSTRLLGVRKVQAYCNGTAQCGTPGGKSVILEETSEMLSDCKVLLCSGIGESPMRLLKEKGIVTLTRKGDIEELLIESARYQHYFTGCAISGA
ncbi:nitrogenase cofactor biosynthesis protein NifB [Gorillibacterium sp. sgz5001074]|uniref:nitrogenase cofactor biosynthesis protein NifB n=1 Tax=Gorillibacterium sp. sgz5001074 TaxID=3446695 RepID=UPI003F6748CA